MGGNRYQTIGGVNNFICRVSLQKQSLNTKNANITDVKLNKYC